MHLWNMNAPGNNNVQIGSFKCKGQGHKVIVVIWKGFSLIGYACQIWSLFLL